LRTVYGLIHSPVFRVFFGDGLAKSCLFIANILLVRELDVSEYSVFAVLSSAIFLGYQLACSPIERLYIADHQRYRYFAKPMLIVSSILAALFSYFVMVKLHDLISFFVILIGVILLALYQFLRISLQQRQWFFWFSATELLKNALWLISLIIFLYIFFEDAYSGTTSISLLILASIVSLLLISPFVSIKAERRQCGVFSFSEMWRLLNEGKFVFGYSLVAAIHPYIPFMLVAQFSDDQTIGSYGAAMRYIGIVSMMGAALNVVFLPHMAKMQSTPDLLSGFVVGFVKKFSLFAPVLLTFALLVSWLVSFVDEGKYPSLPYVFMAFSFLQLVSIFSAPFINLLLINRRSLMAFLIMTAGVLMSLVTVFLLRNVFPGFSPVIGTCFGYIVIAVLAFWVSQGAIKKSEPA